MTKKYRVSITKKGFDPDWEKTFQAKYGFADGSGFDFQTNRRDLEWSPVTYTKARRIARAAAKRGWKTEIGPALE